MTTPPPAIDPMSFLTAPEAARRAAAARAAATTRATERLAITASEAITEAAAAGHNRVTLVNEGQRFGTSTDFEHATAALRDALLPLGYEITRYCDHLTITF